MNAASTQPTEITPDLLATWATDPAGPVALTLKQRLLSVEQVDDLPQSPNSERSPTIIYPPTYADIGYCIDTLFDNKKVALIDSVGSQANRMEPIFKEEKFSTLVPQIVIALNSQKRKKQDRKEEQGEESARPEKRSLLDLAHRGADAVVQSCPTLKTLFEKAFSALRMGDSGPLCTLAPTSLVFGVWDSRGGSGEKRPRLVRSVIRAWNVDILHAAAQFNSVWKFLSEEDQTVLEKEAKAKKVKLSEKGFKDAPAVFKPKTKLPKQINGAPNPEARVLGGIVVHGSIEREVTVNLLALRNLRGATAEKTATIRKYLLGLTLLAATQEIDLFLREGCHLRYASDDNWYAVPRRGPAISTGNLGSETAREVIFQFALDAAKPFRAEWPKELEHQFDLDEAKKLLGKKEEETPDGE